MVRPGARTGRQDDVGGVMAMLRVERLRKVYMRGLLRREPTFTLEADFSIQEPTIIGMMGPNGSGKTTLFELMTGSNQPSAGRVVCAGQDVHRVRYAERARLAMHYHPVLPGTVVP